MLYDVVIVGGGIAGSSLARALCRGGRRVLVLERELEFRDRIRGEGLHPWGVVEARRLGIAELLYERCAQSLPRWRTLVGGVCVNERQLPEQCHARAESMAFVHPEMQQTLLDAAEAAGAEVVRGELVRGVSAELREVETERRRVAAHVVVVADGRSSALRARLGIATERGEEGMQISGVLLDDVAGPTDAVSMCFAPSFGIVAPFFPLPGRRARIYLAAHPSLGERAYAGAEQVGDFLARCHDLGLAREWTANARAAGPLGTFDGTPTWAATPARGAVVLIGDAAGSLDPAFGAGLALALLDARTLAELCEEHDDPARIVAQFVERRTEYHRALLRLERWMGRILYRTGSAADALRARALPRLPELGVDLVGAGPASRVDDATERALFE